MKSIIFPICLLALIIAFMVINSIFISNSIDSLIEMAETLPDEPNENSQNDIARLEQQWNRYKEYYSSVSKYDVIYSISKEFDSAKSGCVSNDQTTYLSAKKSIITVLQYIKDTHSFRLDNII